MKTNRTRNTVTLAIAAAIAMVLSYIEFLLPPIYAALPAIKCGLANVAVLFVLLKMGTARASAVAAVKVILTALLFGSFVSLAYSAAGAVLSLSAMALVKRLRRFSAVGISVIGGVSHNLGQIIMAVLLLRRVEVAYYLPPLIISGTLAGVLIGICAGILAERVGINKNI